MKFYGQNGLFLMDDEPYFVLSGEIHYFRLDPDYWEKHLSLLKESGANTTSTYIPWDWHEYEEGKFDFSGVTHPARNLVGYIELCRATGLNLIVKPGPYILAEYECQGLPEWLLKRINKSAYAVDEHDNIIGPDILTYMSDEYLRYVFKWFDKIMPVISEFQCSAGGPIIMMQVCNEVGVFQWLSGKTDYNRAVVDRYNRYLNDRYANIRELNNAYGTEYKCFSDIFPPSGEIRCRSQFAAYYDFHLFYRHYFLEYFNALIERIKSYGITIQLSHNIPGWIYGHASELPMLISTYSEILKERPEIVFGLDHIPEFVSFRNAHSDLACNKILEAMQKKGPVWAAEFQAGTREHHVKCYARDMKFFYYASLAHGMKSFNYYMFSQGENPGGKGYFGKSFYFQAPLNVKAEKQPIYDEICDVGEFINRDMKIILTGRTDARICIGLYKPYFYTELISSQMLKEKRLSVESLGLYIDPRFIREEVLFNGLLRGLQTLNIPYDIRDLEEDAVDEWRRYEQLWVVCTEYMDPETQKRLTEYSADGGNLIVCPTIPVYDNYLRSCTILKDAFGLDFSMNQCGNKIEAFGIKEIYTFMQKKLAFNVKDEDILARTQDMQPCGIKKRYGIGTVTVLGFAAGYTSDEHLQLIESICSLNHIESEFEVSDPDIQYVVRKADDCNILYLMNYHNQKKYFSIDSEEFMLEPFSCGIIKRFH